MKVFLLSLAFLISSFAFSQNSLLWEVSGNKLKKPSYIYGTMHVKDSRVFQFGDSVMPAFERSQAYAGEILIDPSSALSMVGMMMMSGDTTLPMLLSKEDYELVKKKATEKLGVLASMIDRIKPIFTSAMLSEMEFESDSLKSLDEYFQIIGKEQKKELFGLETVKEQMEALNRTPLKDQAEMLVASLKEEGKLGKQIGEMMEIYLTQDLERLEKFMKESEMPEITNQSILLDRNKVMADRIDTLIRKRSTFIGIGAAHLGGEQGVIRLLQKKGYNVRPVYSGFSKVEPKAVGKASSEGKIYETSDYSVSFPSPFNKTEKDGQNLVICIDLQNGALFALSEGKLDQKPSRFLKQKQKEFKNTRLKIVSSKQYKTESGVPALETTIQKGEYLISTTYYCLEGKYIEMSVTARAEDKGADYFQKFFKSFRKK